MVMQHVVAPVLVAALLALTATILVTRQAVATIEVKMEADDARESKDATEHKLTQEQIAKFNISQGELKVEVGEVKVHQSYIRKDINRILEILEDK